MARSVRFFRRELDISQPQMARVMHVTLDAVKHWEVGRRVPSAIHEAFMRRVLEIWRCPPVRRHPEKFLDELMTAKTMYDSLLLVFGFDINRP